MHVMPLYFFHSSMLLWKKRRGIAIVLYSRKLVCLTFPQHCVSIPCPWCPSLYNIKCLYYTCMTTFCCCRNSNNNDRTWCATHWDLLQNVSSCCCYCPPSPSSSSLAAREGSMGFLFGRMELPNFSKFRYYQ